MISISSVAANSSKERLSRLRLSGFRGTGTETSALKPDSGYRDFAAFEPKDQRSKDYPELSRGVGTHRHSIANRRYERSGASADRRRLFLDGGALPRRRYAEM
jgi:hypothetical protein